MSEAPPPSGKQGKVPRLAVTTDFSEASLEAFAFAGSLARRLGAAVDLVHVTEVAAIPADSDPPALVRLARSEREEILRELESRLHALAASETFRGLEVRPRLLTGGGVELVLDFLEKNGNAMVFIAPHGAGGFKRFLLGSFTAKVLHGAPCPVVVVRGRAPRLD